MIKGIHHVSMKCNTDEEINKVKDKVIKSVPEYPIRMAFCFGSLGEQIEFFSER